MGVVNQCFTRGLVRYRITTRYTPANPVAAKLCAGCGGVCVTAQTALANALTSNAIDSHTDHVRLHGFMNASPADAMPQATSQIAGQAAAAGPACCHPRHADAADAVATAMYNPHSSAIGQGIIKTVFR